MAPNQRVERTATSHPDFDIDRFMNIIRESSSARSVAVAHSGRCPKPTLVAQRNSGIISFMSMTELHKLSPTEKLKVIEALWSDLAADENAFPSPVWHEQELRKTEAEFAAGGLEILDWEDAKAELRKRFE